MIPIPLLFLGLFLGGVCSAPLSSHYCIQHDSVTMHFDIDAILDSNDEILHNITVNSTAFIMMNLKKNFLKPPSSHNHSVIHHNTSNHTNASNHSNVEITENSTFTNYSFYPSECVPFNNADLSLTQAILAVKSSNSSLLCTPLTDSVDKSTRVSGPLYGNASSINTALKGFRLDFGEWLEKDFQVKFHCSKNTFSNASVNANTTVNIFSPSACADGSSLSCPDCGAHGSCVLTNNSLTTTCSCEPNYFGPSCAITCDSCQNGQCVLENGTTKCYCQPGYTGEACDKKFKKKNIIEGTSTVAWILFFLTLLTLIAFYGYHRKSHHLPLNPCTDESRYSSYENFGYGSQGEI